MNAEDTRYLLICNVSDGLIAQLNGVVVQLQLAARMGLKPIVCLHRRSWMFGAQNPYFNEDEGPNVWEYFFEPISISRERLAALVPQGRVYTLSTASELIRLYMWEPKSWYMNPYGYYRSVENMADGNYPVDWWRSQREKVRAFLNDGTVRFRAPILDQVDTLGLQLRGSDKFDFGTGANLSRKVLPEEYFPYIDRYLADHPDCTQIFVATDQRQWRERLEKAYPGKILSYATWSLSETDENRFHESDNNAALGYEVLIDVLLLSRCRFLIKCHASVGELALVLNPELSCIDLNYEHQHHAVKARIYRPLFVPLIRLITGLWRKLAENRMSLDQVVSIDDAEIMVARSANRSRPRPLNVKRDRHHKPARPPLLSRRFLSDALDRILNVLANNCFSYHKRS